MVNQTITLVNISHFKVIDQDSKQVAREAIHIKINNPVHNCNKGKMYIPEIFNSLLGADRLSDRLVQVVGPDLPQGHIHLTIPISRFARALCLAY